MTTTLPVGVVEPPVLNQAIRPDDSLVYYNLACSYALTDQFEQAATALEKALGLGYRDFNWLAKDPDLKKLRQHSLYKRIQAKVRSLKRAK